VFVEPTLFQRVAPLSVYGKSYAIFQALIRACPPITIGLTIPKTRQGGESLSFTELKENSVFYIPDHTFPAGRDGGFGWLNKRRLITAGVLFEQTQEK